MSNSIISHAGLDPASIKNFNVGYGSPGKTCEIDVWFNVFANRFNRIESTCALSGQCLEYLSCRHYCTHSFDFTLTTNLIRKYSYNPDNIPKDRLYLSQNRRLLLIVANDISLNHTEPLCVEPPESAIISDLHQRFWNA